MKYLLFCFFLLFCLNLTRAQTVVRNDTSKVELRSFDTQKIEELKRNKDFQYNRETEPVQSLWAKFWQWVWTKVAEAMSTRKGRITVWTVLVLAALAAIAFFIFQVTAMNKVGIFDKSRNNPLSYTVSSEDIHAISFDEAISRAITEGNFRMALRLLYLRSLKILSDKGYIEWQINKTNNDYIYEVNNKPWQPLFRSLTRQFEYTWYGEKKIGNEDFQRLQLQFQQFNKQLQ